MANNTTPFNPMYHMCRATVNDYQGDNSIYLQLDRDSLVTLKIALEDKLKSFGIEMCHEQMTAAPQDEYPPTSHIGELVALYRRVDAALHGRKTWNSDFRKQEPHNQIKKARR